MSQLIYRWFFTIIGFLVFLCLSTVNSIYANKNFTADTIPGFKKQVDIFPAISYTPETKLTLGAIGYYYLDLSKGIPSTLTSNINFLAVYTTAKQVAIEGRWELFSSANAWRYRGEAFYNRFPDRNYGAGNTAAALIEDRDTKGDPDTINYLPFNSDRIRFAPVVLRKISPNFYIGFQGEWEYLYRLQPVPDYISFLNEAALDILKLPVEGTFTGLGMQALWDTRNNVLNPLKGTFIEFSNLYYLNLFGGDYRFRSFKVDMRKYFNTYQDNTLALRTVINFRFGDDEIPLRGLSRIGGKDFIRGYFKGTYQDNHMTAFEAEYRMPFWDVETLGKWWEIWRRLGIVAFIGGARVFSETSSFKLDGFNLAVGGGLRILLNKESRVNLRIDYAVGLTRHSDGPERRQKGLYFYLAEAF